ncbi:MAG: class I SAM-dependent methyltransferase [Gammaproteobacteria bacterium]
MIMVGSKEEMVLRYCKGADVLDIGCVQLLGDFTTENLKQTLHYRIRSVAKRLVGVDLEEDGVNGLNKLGCECYSTLVEDAHKLDIGEFDIILLGDIIEHIPDPSSFIISLHSFLKSNGLLICTTPNALAYSNPLFILFNRELTRKQHVAWYCRVTLTNLFKLSGFSLHEMHFCSFAKTANNPARKTLDYLLCNLREELSPHLFGVFKKMKSWNKVELQKQRLFHD